MLKDAAITVLRVNLIASRYGYQTKDCHTYNICFDGSTPLFVDLGSFIRINEKRNWASYEGFLAYYYYPLWLWRHGNSYFARKILFSLSLTESMPYESYLLYKHPVLRVLNPDYLKKIIYFYFKFRSLFPFKATKSMHLIELIEKMSCKKDKTHGVIIIMVT